MVEACLGFVAKTKITNMAAGGERGKDRENKGNKSSTKDRESDLPRTFG